MGSDLFYLKYWVNRPPLKRTRRFYLNRYILARSASAVTPRQKSSINTNRKSTTRFPMSLRWSSYVAPEPPNAKRPFSVKKIAHSLKKVCHKVSLCENCQRQSCKAFSGLTIRAIMIGGAIPCTWNFESNSPRWSEVADFRPFSPVAPPP